MAKITWSNRAVDDIIIIQKNASQVSEQYAIAITDRLLNKPNLLKEMPEMGRVVPELNNPDIRELFERQYRIIYRIYGDAVVIMRVATSSQTLT